MTFGLRKFTVGDPMAFPVVKMENKNPQNYPFRLDYVDPHLIQQCLGPPDLNNFSRSVDEARVSTFRRLKPFPVKPEVEIWRKSHT